MREPIVEADLHDVIVLGSIADVAVRSERFVGKFALQDIPGGSLSNICLVVKLRVVFRSLYLVHYLTSLSINMTDMLNNNAKKTA